MNPIFSVWLKPKQTTEYLMAHKSIKYSIILFIIASYGGVLNGLQGTGFTDTDNLSNAMLTVIILISGPIAGLIGLYTGSWLYTLVGKWMGGTGKLSDMKRAIGVTAIPNMVLLIVLVVYIAIFGEQFFQRPEWPQSSILPFEAAMLLNVISLTVGIWNVVITSKMIGVVHHFSSWRGFGVSLVIGVSLAIIFIPLVLILVFI
ncbi:YIP1 family protein [Jeotgalibacillus salarius]|uniref:YIP1 family protein n=1 Tax=Jeotgalibacillus salarius TaxID=546023 RepID=A0A4Y8LFU4_9BACL|nr:YIP1 family protein [Jeotgalibacillus salarius]TFE01684.1 YIP1 family protein [Jeotgalibacillus salarius]